MNKKNVMNMTQGSPARLILIFSLPAILGNLFQQLYTIVDLMIIARTLGVAEMAGVGTTNTLTFLIIQVSVGLTAGFAVPIAQAFGERNVNRMRHLVGIGGLLCMLIAVVSAILTAAFTVPILRFLHTPDNLMQYASPYIRVLFLGIPATMLYNYLSAVLRALGNSRTPLIMLIISSVLNIGLDLFLILVIPMGVAGAALATILSQIVSAVLCLIYIGQKIPLLHLKKKDFLYENPLAALLLKNGLPLALTSSVTAIGLAAVQIAVNDMGDVYVAATAAADKLYGIIACPFTAIGQAVASFTAQNTGAGKTDRIRKGIRSANLISFLFSGVMLLFTIFAGRYLVMIFVGSKETPIIRAAEYLMVCWAGAFVLLSIQQNLSNALQGMGHAGLNVISGLLEVTGRCIAAFLFASLWGFRGLCFAVPLAWLLASAFLIPACHICIKSRRPSSRVKLQTDSATR